MNQNILRAKLQNKQPVYILDDYEDAVIRMTPSEDDIVIYLKRKNSNEKRMLFSDDIVANIMLDGIEITESEYFKF